MSLKNANPTSLRGVGEDSLRPNDGRAKTLARPRGWGFLRRGLAISVSSVLAALILTSALPPLVADQSDRAVVDAPVTLLTAPIEGDVTSLSVGVGQHLGAKKPVAAITNARVDRSTLITLEGQQAADQQNLRAIRAKKDSDRQYVTAISQEISKQTQALEALYQRQIAEIQSQVQAAGAQEEEKKQVVDREAKLVARDIVAPAVMQAANQQYSGAEFQKQGSEAKLQQKQVQLDGARNGIFVGDDVQELATLVQKRMDMNLEAEKLDIEDKQIAAVIASQERQIDAERERLAKLQRSDVETPGTGEIIHVGASVGRHVNAGDTLARMVNCGASFVVGIFSYRQGTNFAPGTRVSIDAGSGEHLAGTAMEVLPKTSDKVDEAYAIPFPQTERRELYVLVKPDHPLERSEASNAGHSCAIGRWVTITRGGGWVPSTSVLWRKAGETMDSGAHAAFGAAQLAWNDLVGKGDNPVKILASEMRKSRSSDAASPKSILGSNE
jgi:biotin carboxyl carrier protein